jgi:hypothetical protein
MNVTVPAWQAQTPDASWIETHLQVLRTDGRWSRWYNMARWTFANTVSTDGSITSKRSSGVDQEGVTHQDSDNLWTNGRWTAYRVRALMHRDDGSVPVIRQIGIVASDYRKDVQAETGDTTMERAIDLLVPPLSQYVHNSEYPQLDGGGAAWCSPASISMVLRYWGKRPTEHDIAALPVDPVFDAHQREDGDVNYAAYHTFDNGDKDKNTGNWAFNTAYAATFGLYASVRQYSSLQELEALIQEGIPVVVTLNWDNSSLDPTKHLSGSSIVKTAGHLMVVRGFTERGEVIVNDPAAPSNEEVRRIYQRSQLERRWLEARGGTVYVIRPH